jgi:hypothetical protein
MPFNPTDELTMRFTVSEWNAVLGQLQEGPWKIVAPLINKINIQAAQQETAQAQPPKPGVNPAYANGEMHADVAFGPAELTDGPTSQ